jgi:hypothetical protein
MFWSRMKAILTGAAVLCGILALSPAGSAQTFPEYDQNPSAQTSTGRENQTSQTGDYRQTPVTAATPYQQAPVRPIPGVRYTTGSVTTTGWEKTLTDGNPNLRRWTWAAITTYTQSSYNKVPAGALAKKDSKENRRIYVRPIHVSPETYAKKREQPGVIVLGDRNSRADLSGRLKTPRQIAQEAPAARSYNINYGVSGKIKAPRKAETIATRQVYGRLVNTQ